MTSKLRESEFMLVPSHYFYSSIEKNVGFHPSVGFNYKSGPDYTIIKTDQFYLLQEMCFFRSEECKDVGNIFGYCCLVFDGYGNFQRKVANSKQRSFKLFW